MVKFSFERFAEGALDRLSERSAADSEARAKADERRAKLADEHTQFLQRSEINLNNDKALKEYENSLKIQAKKEEAARLEKARDKYIQWRNGNKETVNGRPDSSEIQRPTLPELYAALTDAELRGDRDMANALKADIKFVNDNDRKGRPITGAGGIAPGQALKEMLGTEPANVSEALLDKAIFGTLSTPSPAQTTVINTSVANANDLVNYLADQTRVFNEVAGVSEPLSEFSANTLATNAIRLEFALNTIGVSKEESETREIAEKGVTEHQKILAMRTINDILDRLGVDRDEIATDRRLMPVFTPERIREYNRLARLVKGTDPSKAESTVEGRLEREESLADVAPDPLPKNATPADLQIGKLYRTSKGDLFWNGTELVTGDELVKSPTVQ